MRRSVGRSVLFWIAVAGSAFAVGWPPEMRRELERAKTIYVASERKDGTRSPAAPVWFGLLDGELWINTKPTSYKARRARKGRRLFVGLSPDGPFVAARAELSTDPGLAERLGELYARKYWLAWLGFYRPSAKKVEEGRIVLVRLVPLPPEPGGKSVP
ncbi:MAG: hypothetical protein KatS3mg076_0611 [Candidatus Binatia bacterium]|nr:MAG: hypothetical protein KatS3mg076_0611 [Candidatus Binatia bacterium]